MDPSVATLIVAGISFLSAIVITILNSFFSYRKEQRQYEKERREKEEQRSLQNLEIQIQRISDKVESMDASLTLLKSSDQAMLRDRLYYMYDIAMENGFISLEMKQNFENLYKNYHALGKNGVMDQIHDEVMNLPTRFEPNE